MEGLRQSEAAGALFVSPPLPNAIRRPACICGSAVAPVSYTHLSCEAAGRYFARKEKSVLATAVLAGLASLFSLVSYCLLYTSAPQNGNGQEQYVLRLGVLQRLQAEALLLHHQLF